MTANRIHITGASGSGTSTLGALLQQRFGYAHLDCDDYYWMPTNPPFRVKREVDERRRLLTRDLADRLAESCRWVLSGSLCSWGDVFIPQFELVIFLYLPSDIRMARLREREARRYGAAIAPGGERHREYLDFMAWAARYDGGDESVRSLKLHQRWLAALTCPLIRLEGPLTPEQQLARLTPFLPG